MNQTYRRLYILICNIGIPQQIHMENLMVFLLLFFPMLCLWCIGLSFGYGCDGVCCVCWSSCPNLSLSCQNVSGFSWSIGKLWCDWNKYMSLLTENRSPTRIYVESKTHIHGMLCIYIRHAYNNTMKAMATANQITNIWCDRIRVACQNRI